MADNPLKKVWAYRTSDGHKVYVPEHYLDIPESDRPVVQLPIVGQAWRSRSFSSSSVRVPAAWAPTPSTTLT